MVTLRRSSLALLAAVWLASATAGAESPPPAAATAAPTPPAVPSPATPIPQPVPVLHHAPISVVVAHQPMVIEAEIEGAELVARARVVYRKPGTERFYTVPLQRSGNKTGYAGEIPGVAVEAPSLEYAIEIDLETGGTLPVFASRQAPHAVAVADDYLDLRERALDTRLGSRRSVVAASFEYVTFASLPKADVADHYWRSQATYTYRPLRLVTEFGIQAGVLRGVTAAAPRGERKQVGMYYTEATVLFRLVDWCHLGVEGLTGVTDTGFEVGTGAELRIGDPYGSKLAVGFESVHVFGERFYSRVDIAANRRLVVSPMIEATNWPHADRYGVRLALGLAFDVGGGFGVNVQGGYQARVATSGGPGGVAGFSYAF